MQELHCRLPPDPLLLCMPARHLPERLTFLPVLLPEMPVSANRLTNRLPPTTYPLPEKGQPESGRPVHPWPEHFDNWPEPPGPPPWTGLPAVPYLLTVQLLLSVLSDMKDLSQTARCQAQRKLPSSAAHKPTDLKKQAAGKGLLKMRIFLRSATGIPLQVSGTACDFLPQWPAVLRSEYLFHSLDSRCHPPAVRQRLPVFLPPHLSCGHRLLLPLPPGYMPSVLLSVFLRRFEKSGYSLPGFPDFPSIGHFRKLLLLFRPPAAHFRPRLLPSRLRPPGYWQT